MIESGSRELMKAKKKAAALDGEEAPSPWFWSLRHFVATRSSVCLQ